MKKPTKISFILLLLPLTALATSEVRGVNKDMDKVDRPEGLVELKSRPHNKSMSLTGPIGEVDDDKWSNYLTDYCVKKKTIPASSHIGHERPSFCKDGTVSYKQPMSTGFKGWEGKCAQTAGANIVYGLCKVAIDPAGGINDYMRDMSPGVFPSTLKRGLNEIFSDFPHSCESRAKWKWFYNKSQASFIKAMKYMTRAGHSVGSSMERKNYLGRKVKRTPLALLVRDPGSHMLHWITLVDIEEPAGKCMAVINHWDNQYKTPCSTLAKWSKGVSDSYPLIFKAYNMIALQAE